MHVKETNKKLRIRGYWEKQSGFVKRKVWLPKTKVANRRATSSEKARGHWQKQDKKAHIA